MYAISFRIPFTAFGQTHYMNGAFLSPEKYRPGTKLAVTSDDISHAIGEVVVSVHSSRDAASFKWARFIA